MFFLRSSSKKRGKGINRRLEKSLPDSRKSRKQAPPEKEQGPLRKWLGNRNWPVLRIRFVMGFFCLLWIGLWARAWHLQMIEGPHLADRARRQHTASELVAGKRGVISDRNGQALAMSVEVKSVYGRPGEIVNLNQTVKTLAPLLGIGQEKALALLSDEKKKFVWLKRKIDDQTADAIRKAALPGIGLSHEYDRFYPFKHMAGQLLGFVGMDDKGLEGLERSLDDRLGAMPVRQIVQRDAMGRKFYLHEEGQGVPEGDNVSLTLDMQFQFIAEEAIARVVKEYDAKWGGTFIIDIQSGDILAWAQYPFFNPNNYRQSSPAIYRNRLAADALEPGSTFKPFVMAAAIQEKKVTPNTPINCEGGRWVTKNFTIRDDSGMRDIIPAHKVFRYSSNIGMAKIGQALGVRQFHKYLSDLGFGESSAIPVANSRGILRKPRDWGEMDLLATSFGQSIAVTGLQMAQAYLTLLNGGVVKPLRLIQEDNAIEEVPRRIFNEKSVKDVLAMMRDVVQEPDGTGKRAKLDGVEAGGKTGTAQKADKKSRTYGSERLASFVGFFPASQPRYLILIMVDEPGKNQYGGVVAAPVFKEIAGKLLTHTGIMHDMTLPGAPNGQMARKRGFKLASSSDQPWMVAYANISPSLGKEDRSATMRNPGHLARASETIPDVMGKSVRNAVEMFARAGIVPELKGTGSRVVRQSPPPGAPWPNENNNTDYILWLSER